MNARAPHAAEAGPTDAATQGDRQRRRVRSSIAICAGWIGYTLLEAAQYRRQWSLLWPDLTFTDSTQLLMIRTITIWIPLTFAFLALARRIPPAHDLWPRGIVKLGAALVAAVAWQSVMDWLVDPFLHHLYYGWRADLPAALGDYLLQSINQYHTRVYLVALVCYAWVHLRTSHENSMRIAELERRVTHARLDALSASMHPRFLFDALDTIAQLAQRDPDAADRALISLSSLLRLSLSGGAHAVTVAEECTLASDYFAIERARVGAGFDVRWSVAPGCAEALVPTLIVQDLAEGLLDAARVPLHVTLRRHGARLAIEIGTDAPLPGAVDPAPDTLAARLSEMYGRDYALTFEACADARRVARLELPWRTAADAQAAA